jgi:anti-anti-sigma factor
MNSASGGWTRGLAFGMKVGKPNSSLVPGERPPPGRATGPGHLLSHRPPFGGLSTIASIPVVPPRGVPPRDGVGADDPPGGGSGEWLTVTVSWPAPGVGVVRAVGEIDMLTARPWARTLEATCRRLARHGRRGRLVCDLTGVEFFGASGLAALVATATLAAGAGVELALVAERRPVLRYLQIAGLDRSLCIDTHLLAAITAAPGRR